MHGLPTMLNLMGLIRTVNIWPVFVFDRFASVRNMVNGGDSDSVMALLIIDNVFGSDQSWVNKICPNS